MREENARLKRLVADLTLDKQILSDVVKKRSEAAATPGAVAMDVGTILHSAAAGVSASPIFAGGLVSAQPGERPECLACPDPGAGGQSSLLRLFADPGDAPARRLGHQSQTGTSAFKGVRNTRPRKLRFSSCELSQNGVNVKTPETLL